MSVVRVFEDVETAKQAGRTRFNEMLEYLRANPKCKTVLVEKTDRLYRNIRDWVTIDELDLEIHLVKENAIIAPDSRSSEKFMHGIRVLMAKNFIDNLSEEVTKGMQQKARQGIWPSFAPIGYMNVQSGNGRKVIVPDPDRAPIVQMLFETYAKGDCSLSELTRIAANSGLTHRGSGNPLARSAVHKLLSNKIYYGAFDWNGVTYKGKHEPIVSRLLWQKVQNVLASRNRRKTRRVKHDFAFSRLLTCGHCGCTMTAERKKGRYTYYHCTGAKGKCGEPYVREEVLDSRFCSFLGLLEFDQDVIEHLRRNVQHMSRVKGEYHRKVIARLQKEYSKLQRQLDTMYDDKLEGLISAEMFEERARRVRLRMEEVFAAIIEHESVDPTDMDRSVDVLELVRNSRRMYLRRDSAEKRRLLRNLLSNCSWSDGQLTAAFRQPYDMIVDTNTLYKQEKAAGEPPDSLIEIWYPRRDSNPCFRLRRPTLYPAELRGHQSGSCSSGACEDSSCIFRHQGDAGSMLP